MMLSAPSEMSSVRAASGPYAAEPSASRPKTGIHAAGPSLSVLSSDERSGRPNKKSITDMAMPYFSMNRLLPHAANVSCGAAPDVPRNPPPPAPASA